jgi:hypothetical protein
MSSHKSKLRKYAKGGIKPKPIVLEDYDKTRAPKKGNLLLPDINRPYYIDEYGDRRSEYKMGFNLNGKETLLPSVVNGQQLTPEETVNRFRQTGLHMGQYNTVQEAENASRLRTAKYRMLENPAGFNASMYKKGGFKQYALGGPTPKPIYTSNPKDPRLRAYNDSLSLYNKYMSGKQAYDKYAKQLNLKTWKDNNAFTPNQKIQPVSSQGFYFPQDGDTDNDGISNFIKTNDNKEILLPKDLYKNVFTIGTNSNLHGYKKPVQPVIYKKPDPHAELLKKLSYLDSRKPSTEITPPTSLPTKIDFKARTIPVKPTIKHTNNYQKEFDIVDNGSSREILIPAEKKRASASPKETTPKKEKAKSNPKTVYQNYRDGGKVSRLKQSYNQKYGNKK